MKYLCFMNLAVEVKGTLVSSSVVFFSLGFGINEVLPF